MKANNKEVIRVLLFKWKQLVPYASIQTTFMESCKKNITLICPFDFTMFNPLVEIDIIKARILDADDRLKWIKIDCDMPDDLCDEDLQEIYSRYNYMVIEKAKKKVYNHN